MSDDIFVTVTDADPIIVKVTDADPIIVNIEQTQIAGSTVWGTLTGVLTDQLDLKTALDAKLDAIHFHVESDITDLDKYTQAEVNALIAGRAASVHPHVESDITNLDKYTQAEITSLLAGKAPTTHAHVELDITDLDKYTQAEVNALMADLAPGTHTHVETDITDLDRYTTAQVDNLIDTKADEVHLHAESQITDLDKYSRDEIAVLLGLRSWWDHTHQEAQVTNLDKYTKGEVDAFFAALAHTHLEVDITDLDKYTQAETAALIAAIMGAGIGLDTTNFNSNLSALDDTVQKAMETLDETAAATAMWGSILGTLSDQIDLQAALGKKSIVSTSLISGGIISINTDDTKYDVSAGVGVVVDNYTDPLNPVYTYVTFGPFTAIAPANIATQPFTRIGIDKNGNIVEDMETSNEDLRDYFLLGEVDHANNINIDRVADFTHTPFADIGQYITDLARAVGDINYSGNIFSANGANMKIDKSAGSVYTVGANYKTNKKDPSIATNSSLTLASFIYIWRDGAGGFVVKGGVSDIDANSYDDNSGGATEPGGVVSTNSWTVQRVYLSVANEPIIHYGQGIYNTKADALAAIQAEPFDVHPGLADVLFRCWLVIRGGAVDLSNTDDAEFVAASKFGVAGAQGATSSTATLQSAYDNSTDTEIVTTGANGALLIKEGSGIGGNLYEGKDSVDNLVFSIDYLGNLTMQGDLIVHGEKFETFTEIVNLEDNLIKCNYGEVGAGVTSGFSGMLVDRGTLDDYAFLFDEVRDAFAIGAITAETPAQIATMQAVATREDAPIDGGFARWNDAAKRFDAVAIAAGVPVGSIIGVHFDAPTPDSAIWGLCDGTAFPGGSFTTGNKPLLTDDRFLMGGTVAGSGGSNTKTLTTANMPSHTHAIGSHYHSINHDHGSANTGNQSANHTHYTNMMYTSTNGGSVTWQKGASGSPTYNKTTSSNSVSHYHSFNMPAYTGNSGSKTPSCGSSGSGTAFDNKPNYFKCKYFINLK